MANNDLIHRRTRLAFREYAVVWGVLRTIEEAFQMEGFEPGTEVDTGGMRRSLFDSYANAIDWTDATLVQRALRVFESMLLWSATATDLSVRDPVIKTLALDGYKVGDDGRIASGGRAPRATTLPLEQLRDPDAIREHLDRLERAGDSDVPLVISGSKALAEATLKLVLESLEVSYGDATTLPALAKLAHNALKLDPGSIAPSAKGRDTVVRVLSNLLQLVVGLAELRNEYGSDHGRARSSKGLQARHAHLAIGTSATYCRFLLDTLADRSKGATTTD